ncbi:unnamed protein product, partial [marine sediment metagenome]
KSPKWHGRKIFQFMKLEYLIMAGPIMRVIKLASKMLLELFGVYLNITLQN